MMSYAQVGPSSEFERELHNKLNVILWKEFATALAAKVDANVAPVSAGIMARMSTRLVAGFCTSPTRVAQLISALQAPYEWRHPVAPIYSWLKSELARWVDLSFVWQVSGWDQHSGALAQIAVHARLPC